MSVPVTVGRLGRPHGLDGELVLYPDTDNPQRFVPGARLTASTTDPPRLLTISVARPHRGAILVGFVGVGSRAAADELANAELIVDLDDLRPLGDGEYWPEDLVGLEARSSEGEVVGRVVDVVLGGAQDRLVIERDEERFEIPFVEPLVPEVNLSSGVVIIALLPGLLES
jgi:16S rRNA processing protein RimM